MFIDIHTHAYHPKIADKVVAQLEDHYGIPAVGTARLDDLLARAKRAGLDKVVVHNAATSPAQVIPANNWAIRIQRENPGEVVAFGTLHRDYADFEQELDRWSRPASRASSFTPISRASAWTTPSSGPIYESHVRPVCPDACMWGTGSRPS